jgi:hypothetical protein
MKRKIIKLVISFLGILLLFTVKVYPDEDYKKTQELLHLLVNVKDLHGVNMMSV